MYTKSFEILWIFFSKQDLQLEYIHGYRGFDSRNNLHYINEGADIVFHAAGAGIVQNLSTGIKGFIVSSKGLKSFNSLCSKFEKLKCFTVFEWAVSHEKFILLHVHVLYS